MKGKSAIIKMLEQAGVEVVFGLCGDTSLPYYEAFYDLNPAIRHVLTRDERSAAYMADAYARLSGRVGVCEGPSGGGATYILPGVVEANQSSVPLVCLTSDIDSRQRWRGTLTEIDQDALFAPLTVWTKTPENGADLPRTFREAFQKATTGALGATHIGLALNVQEAEIDDNDVFMNAAYGRYPADRTAPDPVSIAAAAEALVNSRNPVIVAGAGVIRSEAWHELQQLTDLLQCPVATSISGKGAIAEIGPYALGVIGSNGGLPYRHEIVRQADTIFYVGCSCGSVTTEKWQLPAEGEANIIQLDVNPAAVGRNYTVRHRLIGDAKTGLAALTESIADMTGGAPLGKFDPERIHILDCEYRAGLAEFTTDEAPLRPERFTATLNRLMPSDGIIITDPGTPTPFVAAYYKLPRAGRYFVTNRAHGALGYSLPASLGAYMARPESKVVAIMGDGSFGFTAGEMETIKRMKAPVSLIVMSNAIFGWIKAGQRVMGEKYFSVDFSRTDHARVARAYGLAARTVEHPSELEEALQWTLESNEPTLLDVLIQPLHETKAPVSKWIA